MSNRDATQEAVWAEKLRGDSLDQQVDALRQISVQETVQGLTVPIVALAGSSHDEVRMWAAEALETTIKPNACEVAGLIELLQRAGDGEVRYWAATMLGRLGTEAVAAAGALESCLRESTYLPARERATWALREIGPSASIAVEALKEASESAPPRLRRMATEALRAITGEIAA